MLEKTVGLTKNSEPPAIILENNLHKMEGLFFKKTKWYETNTNSGEAPTFVWFSKMDYKCELFFNSWVSL